MLVLSRKEDQAVRIGQSHRLTILDIHNGEVQIMVSSADTTTPATG